MHELPPPSAVGPDGRVLRPAAAGEPDPIAAILAAGDRDRVALSRRVRTIAVLTAALLAGTLILGFGATNLSDTPQQREARAADQQVRALTDFAAGVKGGRVPFPPDGGAIVATETGPGLWRVTIRSLDGRCWQVLATTAATTAGTADTAATALRLLAIEPTPYQVEPIHCRFNP
jgi:hypothetical protein